MRELSPDKCLAGDIPAEILPHRKVTFLQNFPGDISAEISRPAARQVTFLPKNTYIRNPPGVISQLCGAAGDISAEILSRAYK